MDDACKTCYVNWTKLWVDLVSVISVLVNDGVVANVVVMYPSSIDSWSTLG